MIFLISRIFKISKCSKLCSFKPSLISTTNKQTLKPKAPLTIVLTKSLCPGTSIKEMFLSFNLRFEKLKLMVICLSCSSFKLSPSKPFKALMSEVFP